MHDPSLDSSYRQTSYFVDTPHSRIRLRVDEPNPELDRFLEEQSCMAWAYLTAFNPHGRQLDEKANHAAQEDLKTLLANRGYRYYTGEGAGDDGHWPAEPSLLVLNITRADAIAIAEVYRQIALLVGNRGESPELVYVRKE